MAIKKIKSTWEVDKSLVVCFHGLSVLYDISKFATGLPQLLCNHAPWGVKELKTISEVIKWVESIKQPKWVKGKKIGKWQFQIAKYE